jgi:hypothetical protein
MAGRTSTFMKRPLLGGVVVLDARPRHLAHSLVHPDDEAKEDRPAADVGAVTGTLLEKGSRSGLARGKPNDHPAAGTGSLSVRQCAMIRLAEAAEPENGLQDVEMIVSGRGTGRITDEFAGIDIELLPHKTHHLQRYQFTGPDQPAWMAQGAELEGEPETVVGPAAAGDCRHVSWIQRVVPDEVGFGGGQGEQRGNLGIGKHAAARHEGFVPVEV